MTYDIDTAEFVCSNTDITKCPPADKPEYAFIGRSNVGKSSLINMLTGKKGLAKTSSTPGKTQLINHFIIDDTWYLVDLPGYGYAKASKRERAKWETFIHDYLLKRENLLCLFVLIDSRHEPQKIDLEFMEWLAVKGIPFVMVFTKTDKESARIINKNIANYEEKMFEVWEELPQYFITSSEKKTGREEVLEFISQLNGQFR
ncbi:MAG: ribosome biogenesis GTP-binding protein YihA/YsxC [Bacteroidia bacterium]